MRDSSDFGFDLGFRTEIINAVEQENLAMFERRTRRTSTVPMPKPLHRILQQFISEKIDAVVRKDPNDALRSASELRSVLRDLVNGVKHPEFKPDLERVEAAMNRIRRAGLERLVYRFLSAKQPEEVEECRQYLIELVEGGCWPEWRTEFEALVDKYCETMKAS